MQIPTRNKTLATCALLTTALLLGSVLAFGQDAPTLVVHFRDSNTDRVPLLTAFPSYPSIARRDRIEGEATVCFMVEKDGWIKRAKVRRATHKIFKRPALRAIKKSSFEPLSANQVLATAKTCRTYRFRLEPILVENAEN